MLSLVRSLCFAGTVAYFVVASYASSSVVLVPPLESLASGPAEEAEEVAVLGGRLGPSPVTELVVGRGVEQLWGRS